MAWKPYQTKRATVSDAFHWWAQLWPMAGIALVLGLVSRLFVIDVDGEGAHRELVTRLGKVLHTPKVMSGSGQKHRYHLLFQHPTVATRAKSTPWHPQLEFRGQGGIVVAPPSLHKSGNRVSPCQRQVASRRPSSHSATGGFGCAKQHVAARTPSTDGHSVRKPGMPVTLPRLQGISRKTRQFLKGEFANGPDWNGRLFAAACDVGCGYCWSSPSRSCWLVPSLGMTRRRVAAATIQSAFAEKRQSVLRSYSQQHGRGAKPVRISIDLPDLMRNEMAKRRQVVGGASVQLHHHWTWTTASAFSRGTRVVQASVNGSTHRDVINT